MSATETLKTIEELAATADAETLVELGPLLSPSRGASQVSIPLANDMHVHFRQDSTLAAIVPLHAPYFGHALAMPNTNPPVTVADQAINYKATIYRAGRWAHPWFTPLPTIMLTDGTTPRQIVEARRAGVLAAKLYPRGATTNSQHGVSDIFSDLMVENYRAMEDCDAALSIHLEDPAGEIMTREVDWLDVAVELAARFPDLNIVFEHVTTARLADWIAGTRYGVAGTITAHHLICTTDDVLGVQGLPDPALSGGGPILIDGLAAPAIRPHYYCLPVAKSRLDRRALISYATSGNRKFFYGSDSAVHDPAAKVCDRGCAGIFVPGKVGIAALAWVFETCGGPDWVDCLARFTSTNSNEFYGLPRNEGTIRLRRRPWTVPAAMGGFVPFAAGHTMPWEPIVGEV
jgi:dihydroorotase